MSNEKAWFTSQQLKDHLYHIGSGTKKLTSEFKTGGDSPKVSVESARERLAARKLRISSKQEDSAMATKPETEMKTTSIDVGSEESPLGSVLSNFEPHSFTFEGVTCNSMEGLIQSFKFEDSAIQRDVCELVGKIAKYRGKKRKWYLDGYLYWAGVRYDRFGEDYQQLLDRAFDALATNGDFQRALIETGQFALTHSHGKTDPSFTILTTYEFCSRLEKVRARLL